jgi:hypothetical protein
LKNEIELTFFKKLMNNRPKVKYRSLNDNSIAFNGHQCLGETNVEIGFISRGDHEGEPGLRGLDGLHG